MFKRVLSGKHSPVGDFVPNAHKARRPQKVYAERLKGNPGSASNAFSSTGCPVISSSSANVNGRYDDDDNDLAGMVDDFVESGSSIFFDNNDSDDGEPSKIAQLHNTLKALTSAHGGIEGELLNAVRRLVLATNVDSVNSICNSEGGGCNGGCIKRLVASQLRAGGYDAAVCKSKWEVSGRVLGGSVPMDEHEYISVEVNSNQSMERLIVDVDFPEQFVVARATPTHLSALALLPTVFVGTTKRLEQILQIMSESVRDSLQENDMPLPPWRTLDFMTSKWLSPHVRVEEKSRPGSPRDSSSLRLKGRLPSMPESTQCGEQLGRVKDPLLEDGNVWKLSGVQLKGEV